MTPPLRRPAIAAWAAILVALAAAPAQAQPLDETGETDDATEARETDAPRPPAERAVELNDEGERLFGEGRYEEAATRFREGYALEPNPTFLYNLALTYEKAGNYRGALEALEEYRLADPEAPDIVAIDARIATLRELIAEIEAEDPEPAVVVRQEPGLLAGPLPWVVAGTGAAGVVVGAILGGVAIRKHDQAVDEPVHRDAVALQSTASDLATAATVTLITGGVVAAVGVSLGVIGLVATGDADDADDAAEGPSIAVRVGPGYAGLIGTF